MMDVQEKSDIGNYRTEPGKTSPDAVVNLLKVDNTEKFSWAGRSPAPKCKSRRRPLKRGKHSRTDRRFPFHTWVLQVAGVLLVLLLVERAAANYGLCVQRWMALSGGRSKLSLDVPRKLATSPGSKKSEVAPYGEPVIVCVQNALENVFAGSSGVTGDSSLQREPQTSTRVLCTRSSISTGLLVAAAISLFFFVIFLVQWAVIAFSLHARLQANISSTAIPSVTTSTPAPYINSVNEMWFLGAFMSLLSFSVFAVLLGFGLRAKPKESGQKSIATEQQNWRKKAVTQEGVAGGIGGDSTQNQEHVALLLRKKRETHSAGNNFELSDLVSDEKADWSAANSSEQAETVVDIETK